MLGKQLAPLDIGGSILGGLASSRLDQILVRDEKLAIQVSAGLSPLQRAGIFSIAAYVRPGRRPGSGVKRLDEILADYLAKGPTQDEIQRAVMSEVSGRIRGLEQVGSFNGKAVALAEGKTLAGNSDFYKQTLDQYAAVTPAAVRSAMQQWLQPAGAEHHALARRARQAMRKRRASPRRLRPSPRTTARSPSRRGPCRRSARCSR